MVSVNYSRWSDKSRITIASIALFSCLTVIPQDALSALSGKPQNPNTQNFAPTASPTFQLEQKKQAQNQSRTLVIAGSTITSAGLSNQLAGTCHSAHMEWKQGKDNEGAVYRSYTVCKSSPRAESQHDVACQSAREQLATSSREDFEFIKSKVKVLCFEH